MAWKTTAIAAALVLLAGAAGPRFVRGAQASECSAADRIDGSSADMARRKMEKAGFSQVRDLKKGCDNFWHGNATKDGAAVNVVLSPQGNVMVEGD